MALKHVRPRKDSNGSGNSYDDALNTFAGLTWGSDTYLVDGGTLYETITFGASGAKVIGLNPNDMPVIDCEATRASGVNLNGTTGCEVAFLTVTGQKAAAPNAAIRVTGSAHHVHHCHTYNNRHGIHTNSSASNRIEYNLVDVGRADELTTGWGIRLNGAGSTGNRLRWNEIICTRTGVVAYDEGTSPFGTGIELFGAASNTVAFNDISAVMCDHIITRDSAASNLIEGNYCHGTGMMDGIDVLNSSATTLRNNTVIHPGDVPLHEGPCSAIGDDYGTGVASTDVLVYNNLFWASNRLCMSIRPLGAGFASQGNRLYRTNGDGDAVCNVNEGAGFVATNMAAWLAKGYVTGDTYGDPLVNAVGLPLVGSPLLTGGANLGYLRDIEGKQGRNYVGAYCRARLAEAA